MAEGKKSRKFGRNAARPSQVRYRTELRMEKNKRIAIKKAAAVIEEAARKELYRAALGKPLRGHARFLRRQHKQWHEAV